VIPPPEREVGTDPTILEISTSIERLSRGVAANLVE